MSGALGSLWPPPIHHPCSHPEAHPQGGLAGTAGGEVSRDQSVLPSVNRWGPEAREQGTHQGPPARGRQTGMWAPPSDFDAAPPASPPPTPSHRTPELTPSAKQWSACSEASGLRAQQQVRRQGRPFTKSSRRGFISRLSLSHLLLLPHMEEVLSLVGRCREMTAGLPTPHTFLRVFLWLCLNFPTLAMGPRTLLPQGRNNHQRNPKLSIE